MFQIQLTPFLFAILVSKAVANVPGPDAEGKAVKYHNCKSEFTIKEVRVTPCQSPDGARCPLKKGTSPTISVTFIPNREVRNLTASVYGIIASIPTEFHLPNRNGCSNSNLACPLIAGQQYTYSQSVHILPSYPNIQLLIRWTLSDKTRPQDPDSTEEKNDVCFIIRASVAD